ncbi:MAG: hypothetical protein RR603_07835, partial [Kurthia sp.]
IHAGGNRKGGGSGGRERGRGGRSKSSDDKKSKHTPSGPKVNGRTRKQDRKAGRVTEEGESSKKRKGKKFYEGIAKQSQKKKRSKKNK